MTKTYSESILELLEGKMVEVHTGDTKHIQNYSDYTIYKKSVIRGKVVDANGDCLVLECLTDKGITTKAYLNGFGITTITEYDGNNMCNIYLDEDSRIKENS